MPNGSVRINLYLKHETVSPPLKPHLPCLSTACHTTLSHFKLPHFVAVTVPLLHPSLHPASLVIGTGLSCQDLKHHIFHRFDRTPLFCSDCDPDAAEYWLYWHIERAGLTSTLDTATSWHLTHSRTLASPSQIQRPLHPLHRPPFRLPPRPQRLPQQKHNKGSTS